MDKVNERLEVSEVSKLAIDWVYTLRLAAAKEALQDAKAAHQAALDALDATRATLLAAKAAAADLGLSPAHQSGPRPGTEGARILEALALGIPGQAAHLAAHTGLPPNRVGVVLNQLRRRALVVQKGRGLYALT